MNMWSNIKGFVQSLVAGASLKREDGQAMVEYGLILALVSVIAVGTLATIGTDVLGAFESVVAAF